MVYILQFSQPLGNENHQAHFYIGSCRDDLLDERLHLHRTGQGAAITRAAVQRGYHLELVATFTGGRDVERRLKRQKNCKRIVERFRRAS